MALLRDESLSIRSDRCLGQNAGSSPWLSESVRPLKSGCSTNGGFTCNSPSSSTFNDRGHVRERMPLHPRENSQNPIWHGARPNAHLAPGRRCKLNKQRNSRPSRLSVYSNTSGSLGGRLHHRPRPRGGDRTVRDTLALRKSNLGRIGGRRHSRPDPRKKDHAMCKVSPQKNGDEDTDMEDARTAAPAKESRELVKSVTVVGRPVAGTGKRASMLKDLLGTPSWGFDSLVGNVESIINLANALSISDRSTEDHAHQPGEDIAAVINLTNALSISD